MNIFFALFGVPTWAWAALAALTLVCIASATRAHQRRYAEARKLSDEITGICRQRYEEVSKKETIQFTHYIWGKVKMQRRAWADITLSSTGITVWIEYSDLASKEEVADLHRLEEILKAAGCRAFMHHLVADQPERPKKEIQPA